MAPSHIDNVTPEECSRGPFSPMPKNHLVWTRRLPHNKIRSLRQDTAKLVTRRKRPNCIWMSKIADAVFREAMVRPMVPTTTALSQPPCRLNDGASDSPNACHDDFGKEGTSQGGSRVVFHSSFPAACNFAESVVLEIRCGLSSLRS